MRTGCLAVAFAVAVMLPGVRAARAAEVEAIHFRYAAPAGCPAEGELVAAAAELGGTFRVASTGEAARSVEIVVEKTDHGFAGSFSVRSRASDPLDERVRTVMCGRCESVVRALGLILAMALANEPPSGLSDGLPTSGESRPIEPEPLAIEAPQDDDPGGIAVMLTWRNFAWAPTGAAVTAVARGWTRLGVIAAISSESVVDPQYETTPTYAFAHGHGQSARLGGVAAWGAPWSRSDWFGFVAEAGLRGGVVTGGVAPFTEYGDSGFPGQFCRSEGLSNQPSCTAGPGTPTTWRFLAPYLAGTLVVQVLPRLPARPFVGLSAVWSGDYRGSSSASFALDAGLAWRSW